MGSSQKLDCTGFYGVSVIMMLADELAYANSQSLAAPLETIGLFGFAWTSLGPPHVHWIAPLIFAGMIAIANVSVLRVHFSQKGCVVI